MKLKLAAAMTRRLMTPLLDRDVREKSELCGMINNSKRGIDRHQEELPDPEG